MWNLHAIEGYLDLKAFEPFGGSHIKNINKYKIKKKINDIHFIFLKSEAFFCLLAWFHFDFNIT
jgi:hypothetical protein